MPNENNLIPLSKRTKSEQRRIQSEGGKASGASRRRKKLFKQLMNSYLDSEEQNRDNWNELSCDGFKPEEITNKAVIVKRLCDEAKSGDVQAVKLVMAMIGEDIQHEELKQKQKEFKRKIDSEKNSNDETLQKLDEVLEKMIGGAE